MIMIMAGKFDVLLVEISSGLLKCPITSIQIGISEQILEFGSVGPVDKNVSFHIFICICIYMAK